MDEIQRLIFQTEGTEKLEALTDALKRQKASVDQLMKAHEEGRIGGRRYLEELRQETSVLRSLQSQLNTLSQSAGGGGSRGINTQGVQQLGYAIQDFVSASGGFAQKLNSVTNNVQGFAASLGVGGAWFLGITGAITAVQLLANNWGKLADWYNGVDPAQAEALKKRVDEAKKKAEKVAESIEKLAEKEGEDPRAKEAGEVFTGAVKDAGGVKKVQQQLAGQYNRESAEARGAYGGLQRAAAERDALQEEVDAYAGVDTPQDVIARLNAAEKALAAAQARVAQVGRDIQTRAGETIDKASKGDQKAIREMAQRFPYTGIPGATSDALAQQDADDEAFMQSTAQTPEGRRANFLATRRVKRQEENELRGSVARTNKAFGQREANTEAVEEGEDARRKFGRERERRANRPLPDWDAVQRRNIGEEFSARSLGEGVQWSPDQIQQATGFIQQQMGQGVDVMSAFQNAFMGLMRQAQAMQQRFQTQANMLNRAFDFGAMGGPTNGCPTYWSGQIP